MVRGKAEIESSIAGARGGSVRASQCVFCDVTPTLRIGLIPLCNKCDTIFHLLKAYQTVI